MKKSFIPLIISTVMIFSGCQKNKIYTSDFFSMDTLCSVKSDIESKETEDIIIDCSSSLDMYSGELLKFNEIEETDNAYIYDITEKTLSLVSLYGENVDITSGELTSLWGISSGNKTVPSEDEIKNSLSTMGYEKISLKDGIVSKEKETKLDFGAVAKGYACDLVYKNLSEKNCGYAIVSVGSSSLLFGEKPDKTDFKIEIKNPDGNIPLGMIETKSCFVSTSGGYERFFEADGKTYSHILDTKTGYPVKTDIVSVTVLCYSENGGIKSDFLATDIFIGGTENLSKHLSSDDYKIVVADKNKKLYVSEGIEFTPYENSGYSL
ncbi:MAG: FAD:protein FMN transferase [Oscillospiraceae bacterium]|nr:FAD:protein FMN transferase [Oscillospiraceae bacterium]